jgi:hypothetical protein
MLGAYADGIAWQGKLGARAAHAAYQLRPSSRTWEVFVNLVTLGNRAGAALAIAALGLGCSLATAHDSGQGTVNGGAAVLRDGSVVSLSGRVSILDVVVPMAPGSERIYALVTADGTVIRIDPGAQGLVWSNGMEVALSGHIAHAVLVVDQVSTSATASAVPPKATIRSVPLSVEGTLKLRHADYFDANASQFLWAVQSDAGQRTELNFAIVPKALKVGMRVQVSGQAASGGLVPDSLTVQALPAAQAKPALQAAETDNVLVILIKFSNSGAAPFTQAAVQTTMDSTTGVAAYWKEASFSQEVLVPTVTAWLTDSKPTSTTCDYNFIASEAQALAVAAGYQSSQYQFQKYVYLFPSNSSCGWAGLGDVGGPDAWSNGVNALWVIGHELGHTMGHGHDNSLVNCNGVVIGPDCVNSQYGDPWGIMGNHSPSMHVNVWQKNNLGWLTAAQIATHTQGVKSYTLSPVESPGGGTYGVAVLANAHRSYWLEFRQPIGFDATLSGSAINGVNLHLANDYSTTSAITTDYQCWDTCFLDMRAAVPSSTDGALPVGTAFTDNDTGVTITAVSKGAGGLTVAVATPTRPTFVDVPLTYWANGAIEALVWNGITKGCVTSPRQFCPGTVVSREQLATFVERAHSGWMFSATPTGIFSDVSVSDPLAGFVETAYNDGIMSSCATSPLQFCPATLVTRAAMAEILMKARNGASYVPPAATGVFSDVPKSDPNAAWIEALYNAGITLGCATNPLRYCPTTVVSRDQMAVFLQRAFSLESPP